METQLEEIIIKLNESDQIYLCEGTINEMATIGRDRKNNKLYQVNPDTGRMGDPYFKIYQGMDWRSADEIVRVLFKKPIAIHHKGDGRKLLKLKSSDLKAIMIFMNMTSGQNSLVTNWTYSKYSWNNEFGFVDDLEKYIAGDYDSETHPSYLSSTLEIPDYTQLVYK